MGDFVMIVITIVLVIALIAGFVFYNYRKNNPKKEKIKGRDNKAALATKKIRSFAKSNGYEFIEPAILAGNNSFANLNGVVVGYFGVLGVKALGYNGSIYGDASDEQWLQVSDREERVYFDNPIGEASADVRILRSILMEKKLRQIPVEVICVFTDDNAQIVLPRNTGHHTLKTFNRLLKKDKYFEDKGFDIKAVADALRQSIVKE